MSARYAPGGHYDRAFGTWVPDDPPGSAELDRALARLDLFLIDELQPAEISDWPYEDEVRVPQVALWWCRRSATLAERRDALCEKVREECGRAGLEGWDSLGLAWYVKEALEDGRA